MRAYHLILLLILLLGLGVAATFPTSRSPQIVVNMPAGAKPLAQLTQPGDKVVGPDRAILYWTVYKNAADHGWSPNTCAEAADHAVKTVYGPLPSHP